MIVGHKVMYAWDNDTIYGYYMDTIFGVPTSQQALPLESPLHHGNCTFLSSSSNPDAHDLQWHSSLPYYVDRSLALAHAARLLRRFNRIGRQPTFFKLMESGIQHHACKHTSVCTLNTSLPPHATFLAPPSVRDASTSASFRAL